MILTLIAAVILFGCIALLYNQGIWSSLLTLINTTIAAILAWNLYEPVASMLGKELGYDALALWFLFILIVCILRLITDTLSGENVRFDRAVDIAGSVGIAVLVSWVVLCFTVASLHVLPVGRSAFNGAFMESPDAKTLSFAPDRLWLAFMHTQSQGALGRDEEHVFDTKGEFIDRYAARRQSQRPPAQAK